MPEIELGYDWLGDPVYYYETLGFGVIMIIAVPRYGKSILVRNIYTQIAAYRNIVIFDYQGEHSDSKWGNWRSEHRTTFIPDLVTIENFGFYVSDFDQYSDWVSMGFSEKSVPLLMRIVKNVRVHSNSPEEIQNILSNLPTSTDTVSDFNDIWPDLKIAEAVNYSIKQSMSATMRGVIDSGLIIAEVGSEEHLKNTPEKIHIDDWARLIKETPHVNINLNLFSSGSVSLARASVGKILERFLPVLDSVKPLIVVEEAAKICPNTGDTDEEQITSQIQLRDYCIRHQRTGVKLMFITQDPNLMDQDTLGSGMTWIFGIHTPNAKMKSVINSHNLNYEKDIVSKLRHDDAKGFRDFAIIEVGKGGKYDKFTPYDSASRIPKKQHIHSSYLRKNNRIMTHKLRKYMLKGMEYV